MKFTCNQKDLHSNLTLVLGAISSHVTHPILSAVKIEASDDTVKLTGFDLSIAIESEFDAVVSETGNIAISAKLLSDITSKLSGEITISETANGGIEITSMSGQYSISGMDVGEYPELPTVEGDSYEILASTFLPAISRSLVSCSRDESKMALTGVCIKVNGDSLECAATDGHRLTVVKMLDSIAADDSLKAFEVIVPSKALEKLSRILQSAEPDSILKLKVENSQIVFILGNKVLITRTIEGTYPNYQLLVPTQFSRKIVVDRKQLLEALVRTTVLSDATNLVKFDINTLLQSLEVSVKSQDIGNAEEKLTIEAEGADIQVAFNSKYLMDGLRMLQSKKVSIEMNGAIEPVILREIEGMNVLYLAMPIQLRE